MGTTVLLTGFGPFPGAPFNPTGPLVKRLARLRRPALAQVTIVPHIFRTSYAAVDGDLPRIIAMHRPDALLMFGLATRARSLRIETRARNTLSIIPDAAGLSPHRRVIAAGASAAIAMPAQMRRLLAAVHTTSVPVTLSHDAGRYLCNYLCWRAAEAAGRIGGPRLAAFVHVPTIARGARQSAKRRKLTLGDLTRAGTAILVALATDQQ